MIHPEYAATIVRTGGSANTFGATDTTLPGTRLVFEGADSSVRIADNGVGMDTDTITGSLRIGSIRDYGDDDLGKFGFGLKTASTSQCRRVVLASRRPGGSARVRRRASLSVVREVATNGRGERGRVERFAAASQGA